MTASAALRESMAARIAELRAIPADPVERAQLLAERIAAITGCQCGEPDCWRCRVNCWRCRCDQDPSDVQPDGLLFACKNQGECNRRAAEFAEAEDAERFYEAAPEYEDEEFAYAARGRGDTGGI